MSTTTVNQPAAGASRSLPRSAGQLSFAGALRSELTKIRSVRSTYWTLIATLVVVVAFGALACIGATTDLPRPAGWDPTRQSLFGLYLGPLLLGVLGVLVISSEYSTGMIRTSLTTNPHRGVMIAAKGLAFTMVALAASLVTSFAAFFTGQAILSTKHIGTSLGSPRVLGAVIGGAVFLALCGVIAFGIGLLIRYTAAGVGATMGLLFVLTIVVQLLPMSWQNDVDRWVPAVAGSQLWTVQPPDQIFGTWGSLAVLCGWAALALIPALALFHRRDA